MYTLPISIAKSEKADLFIVEMTALLHDVGDFKFFNGDEKAGEKVVADWLNSLELQNEIIDKIIEAVNSISFKGANVKDKTNSIEAKVVQDTDRLDALGAVGIARTFSYGGSNGRELYNPNIKPKNHKSFEEYKKNKSSSINHFYEKLLLLKDRMHTKTAKKMAEKRHHFMKKYLEQFFNEWEGRL